MGLQYRGVLRVKASCFLLCLVPSLDVLFVSGDIEFFQHIRHREIHRKALDHRPHFVVECRNPNFLSLFFSHRFDFLNVRPDVHERFFKIHGRKAPVFAAPADGELVAGDVYYSSGIAPCA